MGNLPVLLSEVNCRGNEDSILDCPARRSDFTDCELEATDGTDATVVACTTVGEASGTCSPFAPRPYRRHVVAVLIHSKQQVLTVLHA